MWKLLRTLFEKLMKINDTPERTALAFAIGVFLAFSPFLGLHTILALAIAFLFGLNRLAVLIGVYTNTPWTIVPFYAFATYFGQWFYKMPEELPFHIGEMSKWVFWKKLFTNWSSLWPLLMPTFVGSLILSILAAVIAYPISLKIIRLYREQGRI